MCKFEDPSRQAQHASGFATNLALEDEHALRAVGSDEAVDGVVDLAAEATALVEAAHQLLGTITVFGVLGGVIRWRCEFCYNPDIPLLYLYY